MKLGSFLLIPCITPLGFSKATLSSVALVTRRCVVLLHISVRLPLPPYVLIYTIPKTVFSNTIQYIVCYKTIEWEKMVDSVSMSTQL